ncbi:MAG: hypothetical protein H7A33_06135 [Deltaproteobacteria bacterium]|nr:hypothetical protein [Deltaproteobacteria bacterium]
MFARIKKQILCWMFLLPLLFACAAEHTVSPYTLRLQLSSEPATLNPMTSVDAYSVSINQFIFDKLLTRDLDTLAFKPSVASSWDVSEDGLEYTFHIKKEAKWQDGVPVTADDVVFSYQTLMDPKVPAGHLRVYYSDIESVEALDSKTVRFRYKRVYFKALEVVGFMDIIPKHIVEQYKDFDNSPFSRAPLGNGPFKFKEWVSGQRIILERNEDYWGDKTEIKTIEFKLIPDSAVAFQILKKGDLDVMAISSLQWARQTRSKRFTDRFYKPVYMTGGYSYIAWNNSQPPFDDFRVRRAMTHMIDRRLMSQKLKFGLAAVATGPFFPNGTQINPNVTAYEFDPETAVALLKEAGWEDHDGDGVLDKNGKQFEFKYLYPSASKAS